MSVLLRSFVDHVLCALRRSRSIQQAFPGYHGEHAGPCLDTRPKLQAQHNGLPCTVLQHLQMADPAGIEPATL